jgi:hypothetical protein
MRSAAEHREELVRDGSAKRIPEADRNQSERAPLRSQRSRQKLKQPQRREMHKQTRVTGDEVGRQNGAPARIGEE